MDKVVFVYPGRKSVICVWADPAPRSCAAPDATSAQPVNQPMGGDGGYL